MVRDIERRDFVKGVGTAGIVGLAGCTGSQGDGGGGSINRSSPIRYGVLLPQTGDLASVGTLMVDAATLPTKQLSNADLGGLSVENQVADTQTSPPQGISAANSLVNAGIPAVAGPASSGVNIQVSKQVLIPNKIVGCSPSSTAPSVTNLSDNGFVYRTAPSDALQGQVMAQVANQKLKSKSAATLYVNNDYGQLLSEAFAESFNNAGGKVQKQVSFEKQQSSYTSKLQSALNGNPDLLVIIGYPASGIQIFKDFYSDFDKTKTEILLTDGLKDPKVAKSIGEEMTNVTGTAPKPAGPAADAFAKMFNEEYGEEPGVFNAHSYDAAASLILANAAAGENNGPAVKKEMQNIANPGGTEVTVDNLAEGVKAAARGETVQYKGASSAVDYDDKGDMKAVTYSVWTFEGDAVKVTDSIQFKKGE